MMCYISIVVPVYNVEKYIEECIDSILNQTFKDFELIIINDASTDSSFSKIKKYHDHRIRMINSKENVGLGLTRNKGIDTAQGKYITFIDSDDYIDPDYINRMITCMESNKVDLCISPGFYLKNSSNTDTLIYINKDLWNKKIDDCNGIRSNCYGLCNTSCGCIFLSSIIHDNNICFMSEKEFLSEDVAFILEYLQHCESVFVTDFLGYYYRYNPSSLSRRFDPERFSRLRKTVVTLSDLYHQYNVDKADEKTATYYWSVYEKCVNQIIRYGDASWSEKISELKNINDSVSKNYLSSVKTQHRIKGFHLLLCDLLLHDNYIMICVFLTLYNFLVHHKK